MTNLIVFDDGLATLRPLTDLRPAFDVRTGAMTTLERILKSLDRDKADALLVPERLAELTRETHEGTAVNALPEGDSIFVSARCALPALAKGLGENSAMTEQDTGDLIAMRAGKAQIESYLRHGELPGDIANTSVHGPQLFVHPWDVIRHRDACVAFDLASLTACMPPTTEIDGVTMLERENIHIHDSATVLPTACLDATTGPIVIDEGVTVRLGAVIIGPAYIGKNSTILDRALIKGNSAVGPVCKVAGELGGTIIQGHTNKAHDGHIGDSWLGEWVNLGAGTTNSNLLNTYGEITVTAQKKRYRTGLTFLGTIAGDHAKTAICTRLMTGTILGTGTMVASTVPPPRETRPFAWLTDELAQTYRTDKFLDVMRTVMSRRKVTPSDAYVRLIRDLAEPDAS